MPFRMLRYVVRIWDRYVAEHPEATRLPAVIPLVVQGVAVDEWFSTPVLARPWTGPVDVRDLIDLDGEAVAAAGELVPRFRFLLDDLAQVDELALRARPLTASARLTLLLLKIAGGNTTLVDDASHPPVRPTFAGRARCRTWRVHRPAPNVDPASAHGQHARRGPLLRAGPLEATISGTRSRRLAASRRAAGRGVVAARPCWIVPAASARPSPHRPGRSRTGAPFAA